MHKQENRHHFYACDLAVCVSRVRPLREVLFLCRLLTSLASKSTHKGYLQSCIRSWMESRLLNCCHITGSQLCTVGLIERQQQSCMFQTVRTLSDWQSINQWWACLPAVPSWSISPHSHLCDLLHCTLFPRPSQFAPALWACQFFAHIYPPLAKYN